MTALAQRDEGVLARVPVAVLIVGCSLVWGSNFVAIKEALHYTTPLVMGAGRALIGGTLLVAIGWARGLRLPRRPADLKAIAWVAFHMTTLSTAFLILSVSRLPAGLASLLGNTMPLFMVVLAVPMLGELPHARSLMGMAIGFVGTTIIALPAIHGETSPLGVLYCLLAVLTWASGSIIYKRADLGHIDPVMVVGVQLWFSAAGLAVVAGLLEDWGDTRFTVKGVAVFLYLACIGLAFVFLLWAAVLRRATAMQASASAYLVPVVGVISGAVLLGEKLTMTELFGGVLVLAGVAVISTRRPVVVSETLPE